jgi:hypothetical protein
MSAIGRIREIRESVKVPTLVVAPPPMGNELELWVQWFGEGREVGPDEQFLFPVPLELTSMMLMGHPELCNVVMLGKAKDWPRKDVVPQIARMAKGEENWILWIVATHYTQQYPSGPGPGCAIVPMNIILVDEMRGIISPRHFLDMEVLNRENQRCAAQK